MLDAKQFSAGFSVGEVAPPLPRPIAPLIDKLG